MNLPSQVPSSGPSGLCINCRCRRNKGSPSRLEAPLKAEGSWCRFQFSAASTNVTAASLKTGMCVTETLGAAREAEGSQGQIHVPFTAHLRRKTSSELALSCEGLMEERWEGHRLKGLREKLRSPAKGAQQSPPTSATRLSRREAVAKATHLRAEMKINENQ